jgi:ADP-ribose pyrophosphatase
MDEAHRIDRRAVFAGRVLHLFVDRVRLPNGNEAELEVLEHPGAAAVVAIDGRGRVLLVRQYRYAAGEWMLEVPAGKLDPGESPEACARRELVEETGHRAGRLEPLGWIWTTPGFTNEKIWLFRATELVPAEPSLQHDEVLSVETMAWGEAIERAAAGEIHDAKSAIALLRSASYRSA